MKIAFLIPARGGSKRIPNKNLASLCGKPMISYMINVALKTELGDVWISTDSLAISDVAKKYGAEVLKRPKEIADDQSPLEDTIEHFLSEVETDVVIICEPTNPLTRKDDLLGAIHRFQELECDSLVCLQKGKVFIWKTVDDGYACPLTYDVSNRERVQDFDFSKYQYEEGGIYITTATAFKNSGMRLSGKIGYYTIPHKSINIDDMLDLKITETIMVHEKEHEWALYENSN